MGNIGEWQVFLAFVAIIGFIITIFKASRYFSGIENATQMLTESIKLLREEIKTMGSSNYESHQRLWKHNEEQDSVLADHETRLSVIEQSKGRFNNHE